MTATDELNALNTFINEHEAYFKDVKGISHDRYLSKLYAYNALLLYRNYLAQAIEANAEIDWQLTLQMQIINHELKAK